MKKYIFPVLSLVIAFMSFSVSVYAAASGITSDIAPAGTELYTCHNGAVIFVATTVPMNVREVACPGSNFQEKTLPPLKAVIPYKCSNGAYIEVVSSAPTSVRNASCPPRVSEAENFLILAKYTTTHICTYGSHVDVLPTDSLTDREKKCFDVGDRERRIATPRFDFQTKLSPSLFFHARWGGQTPNMSIEVYEGEAFKIELKAEGAHRCTLRFKGEPAYIPIKLIKTPSSLSDGLGSNRHILYEYEFDASVHSKAITVTEKTGAIRKYIPFEANCYFEDGVTVVSKDPSTRNINVIFKKDMPKTEPSCPLGQRYYISNDFGQRDMCKAAVQFTCPDGSVISVHNYASLKEQNKINQCPLPPITEKGLLIAFAGGEPVSATNKEHVANILIPPNAEGKIVYIFFLDGGYDPLNIIINNPNNVSVKKIYVSERLCSGCGFSSGIVPTRVTGDISGIPVEVSSAIILQTSPWSSYRSDARLYPAEMDPDEQFPGLRMRGVQVDESDSYVIHSSSCYLPKEVATHAECGVYTPSVTRGSTLKKPITTGSVITGSSNTVSTNQSSSVSATAGTGATDGSTNNSSIATPLNSGYSYYNPYIANPSGSQDYNTFSYEEKDAFGFIKKDGLKLTLSQIMATTDLFVEGTPKIVPKPGSNSIYLHHMVYTSAFAGRVNNKFYKDTVTSKPAHIDERWISRNPLLSGSSASISFKARVLVGEIRALVPKYHIDSCSLYKEGTSRQLISTYTPKTHIERTKNSEYLFEGIEFVYTSEPLFATTTFSLSCKTSIERSSLEHLNSVLIGVEVPPTYTLAIEVPVVESLAFIEAHKKASYKQYFNSYLKYSKVLITRAEAITDCTSVLKKIRNSVNNGSVSSSQIASSRFTTPDISKIRCTWGTEQLFPGVIPDPRINVVKSTLVVGSSSPSTSENNTVYPCVVKPGVDNGCKTTGTVTQTTTNSSGVATTQDTTTNLSSDVSLSVGCIDLTQNLMLRSRGSDVKKLQNFLIEKGFVAGTATGYFGGVTQRGVKKYQASVGLDQSGAVLTQTRAAIKAETCSSDVSGDL
ncbi:MAG: putative peptidoglycan binding domain [Candidatus Parcubacteria bacterium]